MISRLEPFEAADQHRDAAGGDCETNEPERHQRRQIGIARREKRSRAKYPAQTPGAAE
jgi:hypothetical protein